MNDIATPTPFYWNGVIEPIAATSAGDKAVDVAAIPSGCSDDLSTVIQAAGCLPAAESYETTIALLPVGNVANVASQPLSSAIPTARPTSFGEAAALSPRTRFTRAKTWGWFLNYLNVVGDLDSSEPFVGRLTPARLDGYIRSLRARVRASTAWHEIVELSYMAALLAPEQDWSWIRRRPELPSAREVRASRKPLNPPDMARLFHSALLYCRAADDETGSIPSAVRFRNGLIVAFASWSVLRRRNLSEMQLGVHLQMRGGIARIVFDKTVKNGQTIDSLVPDSLMPVLETYLRRQRPLLLRGSVCGSIASAGRLTIWRSVHSSNAWGDD
jgi:hypothetical protein